MPAVNVNVTIYRGSSVPLSGPITTPEGVDLDGALFIFHVDDQGGDTLFELDSDSGGVTATDGVLTVPLSQERTLLLTASEYTFSIWAELANGEIHPLTIGTIKTLGTSRFE